MKHRGGLFSVGSLAEQGACSIRIVRDFLDGFWPSHLAALKQAAEAESKRNRGHG